MQIARFSDGGFVLHKLKIHCSSMHFSAWFDKAGKIIDVEGFDRMGRSSPIKKDGPCWKEIAMKGKYYQQESVKSLKAVFPNSTFTD